MLIAISFNKISFACLLIERKSTDIINETDQMLPKLKKKY